MTPQVVTETLYALSTLPDPFFPTDVHVVTTTHGQQRISLELLGDEQPWFSFLYRDYDFPQPAFDSRNIHVLRSGSTPLDDIRTEEENLAAADGIAEHIRTFTADPDCALHVSIAGGRKSMSYFAGAALSLYGRPQDRLSHVLVSDAYEGNSQFFYPSPRQRVIYNRDHRPLNAADATVTLADIPFVRLRQWLPAELLRFQRPFADAIEQLRAALEPQILTIDLLQRTVSIGDRHSLAPYAELAFFLWVLSRQRRGIPLQCPGEVEDPELGPEFETIYMQVHGDTSKSSRTRKALRNGMDRSYFLQRRSRWNRFLQRHFGPATSGFHVQSVGKRGDTAYVVQNEQSVEIVSHLTENQL